MKNDTSHSIIGMIKQNQSRSMLRSSMQLQEFKKPTPQSTTDIIASLSSNPPKKPLNILKSLPKSRQPTPYRLCIKKLSNLPTLSKKSTQSSLLFLHLTASLYTKKPLQLLGTPLHYQCEQALQRKDESKHEYPICLYYHSRVDKNAGAVFLVVGVKILEMRAGVVQNQHKVGFFVVDNPFVEASEKNINLCKEPLCEISYPQYQSYAAMAKGQQSALVEYEIESALQLKLLTKLIPQNTIVSPQMQIVGANDQFLSQQPQLEQIIQSSTINLKLKYLQIHIPQNFEQFVLSTIRAFPNGIISQKDVITARKVCLGLVTQRGTINLIQRRMEYVDRETMGDLRIAIYQGLKDGQTLNYQYYIQDRPLPIAVSLIYQLGNRQIQAAYYLTVPTTDGSSQQLSQQMLTTPGPLTPLIKQHFIRTQCKNRPTIIAQYMSEDILMENESFIDGRGFKDSRVMARSSHKLIQDKTQQLKEKERLLQEVEYEKMCLEKERQEVERVKTENYILYQEEFERKFQLQKEALAKRQELLENQYREQVEREIRQKAELQQQITQMKQKMRKIQQQQQGQQHIIIQGDQPHQPSHNYHFPGSFNTSHGRFGQIPQSHRSGMLPFQIKEKIDPIYLLEAENSIPVAKVREMIRKKQPSVSKELVEVSRSRYQRGSRVSFTFESVIWNSQSIQRPREVYFVMRFFNFGQFRTDRLTYLPPNTQNGHCQLIRVHQYNYSSSDTTPTYIFTFDPSEYRNPKLIQQDFTQYLCENSCIIDIFDGQSHIYLGQINVKLGELVRGNRMEVFIAKEYNLVKVKSKEVVGQVHLIVRNEEVMCKNGLGGMGGNSTVGMGTKEEKKKVVSYASMTMPLNQNKPLTSTKDKIPTTANKLPQTNRLQQRISNFKQRQTQRKLQNQQESFFQLPDDHKTNTLAKINQYKERNMQEYIKTVYSTLLNENITINAEFGKAETFPYTFVNQSQTSAAYKVVIDGKGSGERQAGDKVESDLDVVKEPVEWRYYVKKKGYVQPKFYEIIDENDVFYLSPGENLTMIFKYLTFNSAPKYHSSNPIINVSIVKVDSNWIAGGFTLNVQLHEQVIHHSYVLYQPGDQLIELIMPVIYTKEEDYGPGAIKKLYLTDHEEETQAQWLNQYEILLKAVTPGIMQRKTFNLLLYDDEYFDELKENWLISIHSYEGVWAQCRMDYTTRIKLALPMNSIPQNIGLTYHSSLLATQLKLNSSDPSLRFQNDKILAQVNKMRENGAFEIWCQIHSPKNLKKQIEITCTSQENSSLVYGWIVQVFPYVTKRN